MRDLIVRVFEHLEITSPMDVNINLKTHKDQINEAMKNEPTFDSINFNLSSGTSNPLPVVTVFL